MITFEQARQRVIDHLAPSWAPGLGELVTLPTGAQDETHWMVPAGARESLIDGDHDFDVMDMPAMLVSKLNGAVTEVRVIDNVDRLAKMTPTT